MSEIVIDTSVWIEFFRGKHLPIVESALKEGRVLLPPIVCAELLSGVKTKKDEIKFSDFLRELEIISCDQTHWLAVGLLRSSLLKKGYSLSIPDAHILQCALERPAILYSFDPIFKKVSSLVKELQWIE